MNPFVYPKTKHVRTQAPKQYRRYQTFKKVLRTEFAGKCVYCRMPSSMREYAGFGVDHYRPKKIFPSLDTIYANLYYCCNACNSCKGSYWPNTTDLEKTHFIPNPCDHQMFDHLRFNGAVVDAKSSPGRVALEILDLNDPESLQFREFILSIIQLCKEKRAVLVQKREKAAKKVRAGTLDSAVAVQANREIDSCIADLDSQLRRLRGSLG